MREIVFGNLNFNIVDSYRIMKSRINNEKRIYLFEKFPAKPTVCKTYGLLGGVEIEFEIDRPSISIHSDLSEIESILMEKYGDPDYITRGTMKVWQEKDYYILHGMDEKNYQVDVHIIKLCFKKPPFFMLSYAKYSKYVEILNEISTKRGLAWRGNLIVLKKQATAWMDTKNYSYCISFSQSKFAFYSSEKKKENTGTRLVPSWNTKGKYKTIQDLHIRLDSFFDYLKEYDSSLKED